MRRLRDSFEFSLAQAVDGVTVHSGAAERIPNTSNLAFSGCTAEALMLLLEPAGLRQEVLDHLTGAQDLARPEAPWPG